MESLKPGHTTGNELFSRINLAEMVQKSEPLDDLGLISDFYVLLLPRVHPQFYIWGETSISPGI
jgi:hypothetical protein